MHAGDVAALRGQTVNTSNATRTHTARAITKNASHL